MKFLLKSQVCKWSKIPWNNHICGELLPISGGVHVPPGRGIPKYQWSVNEKTITICNNNTLTWLKDVP